MAVRNMQAEIHSTMDTLLFRKPRELNYPKCTRGLLVSHRESNVTLLTSGTSGNPTSRHSSSNGQIRHWGLFKAGNQVPGAHLLSSLQKLW